MLNVFRALGGVAENIRGGGSADSGLYAMDVARPVSLLVPQNLCFAIDDVDFSNEEIGLKDTANVAPGERNFFETYTRAFSWCAEGETESAKFLAALDALASEVCSLLQTEFAMADLFNSDRGERTKAWLLRSRRFRWKGRDWFIPILDLARHGAQGLTPALDARGRLQIEGKVSGEILVWRGAYDTLGVFQNFGVFAPQDLAYSLPLSIKGKTADILVRRNASKAAKRGAFMVPQVAAHENAVTFSYLMIGHPKFPKLSRGIFVALARDTQIARPDEAFDRVLFANRMKFLELIGALEPYGGETVITLRRVAHIQLERISHCIGTRGL